MSHLLKKPSILLIICLVGFPQISETIYTPSLPLLAEGLNSSMQDAEFTLSIYFIGFALGVLSWGALADTIGRRKSLLSGILVYFIASLGCSFSSSIEWLLFFRLIQAFGASAGSVVTQTIIRDLFSGNEKNRVFATVSAALSLSPALGPFIGGFVVQFFGWKANFYVLVVMGILLWIYSYRYLGETKPDSNKSAVFEKRALATLLSRMSRDPHLWCHGLLIGICNGILFSYYAEAPYLFIEVLKLSPSQYGLLGLGIAASFFFAAQLYRRLIKRFSTESITIIGSMISCAGSIALTAVASLGLIDPKFGLLAWTCSLIPLLAVFLGLGIIIPNSISNALTQYQNQLGTAGSIFGFSYYCLIAGFTALMSILHDGSTRTMPSYFMVMSLLMLGAGLVYQKRSALMSKATGKLIKSNL